MKARTVSVTSLFGGRERNFTDEVEIISATSQLFRHVRCVSVTSARLEHWYKPLRGLLFQCAAKETGVMLNSRIILTPGLTKISQEQFRLFGEDAPLEHTLQQRNCLIKAAALGQKLDKP